MCTLSSKDSVAALRSISDNDDLMLSTTHGTIVRQARIYYLLSTDYYYSISFVPFLL